ncbi:hypothetical protein HPB52_011831 [Rhipicephalus sanguineus]|uniref:Uncharacterized protein n=1 Tax=Rhipicephalus sanguineus TaxID=34632 RepID=A0A9D4T9R1_RHISA|nr:hypothetical protein HPB52_011831 [Rhipicephalus sanguineus]
MDPKGRALMVAAVEKQKLVYILNRDAAARLTISSPLEAHKSSTLVYHCVGVDVGFENPVFACLEMDYESMFFFLAQTEQGDIFKITLETDEDMVTEIKLKYFDTIPVAASMCVLKTGFLFVAAEFGNHCLYQIARLGEEDEEPEFSSAIPLEEGDTFFFAPRALRNLLPVEELDSLSPAMGCTIADLANEDTPQLYVACGRGPRSCIRVLRHGLEVSEMAVSELPGNPNAVWTVKRKADEDYDAYIIVSFVNATLVLSIGETVEEVTDSGFLGTTPTLSCAQIGDDALVQVYPEGIRHIRADKRVNEWRTPGKKAIVKCAVNQRQVVIALTGGELVYFEMDPTGQLNEYTDRREMSADIICMSLASVPTGEQRSRFLALESRPDPLDLPGTSTDDTVGPSSTSETLRVDAAYYSTAEQAQRVERSAQTKTVLSGKSATQRKFDLLGNGVLLRTVLDQVTGDLSDTRTRYLGSRPVKLFKVRMQGSDAALAMSSRSWLSYYYQNRFHLTPLSYETLEFASGFSSEQCPEGIVAISTNTLRILALEKLGAVFNQVSTTLEYTPRKFVVNSDSGHLIIVETDHNAYTEKMKQQRKQQMAEEMVEAAGEGEQELAAEMAAAFLKMGDVKVQCLNFLCAALCMQASLTYSLTYPQVALEQNEAALSVALVKFASQPDEQYVVVGAARELSLQPWHARSGGLLLTYRLSHAGETRLELVHATSVEEAPTALCPFQGRLLAGVGKCLRLYDLGRKKLLRKCENKYIPSAIVSIQSMGNRVVVGDVQESFFFLRYKRQENQLVIFADDAVPRWITASCMLDYDTVAGADKFGNVSIIRLPNSVSDEVDEDPTGIKSLWDRGWLGGSSQKAEVISNFHIGETVLSLQKATLIPGGSESLVYVTLSGTIGVLVPFTAHEDHDFFQHLEMHMRSENPPLCGRDHLSFRSSYFPVKNVIDGDLCEQFNSLDPSKQKSIAEELDRNPSEV